MLKVVFTLLVLASVGLAQSSSDGSFSVRHAKHANFSLNPAQMREAESLYKSACAVVQHDFQSDAGELHPHFMVIIGANNNEVHVRPATKGEDEIWLKKWDPPQFAKGVVVLAFDKLLTADFINRLGNRAIRYSSATVDVAGMK